MARTEQQKAVIYCRVSDTKQTTRGSGLESQETRCREYANYRGHDVIGVFKDDASGGQVRRPGMANMLAFLRSHRKDQLVVIIDDISRLARGLEAHIKLRADIASAGGVLESPSIEFGEDSDSQLVENLLAAVSQHQRQKNGEQTKNRMRARALNGYWVYQPPIGYRFERAKGGGKILVPDEPIASIIKEAIEGFASGRFASQAEVKRFLESRPLFPQCPRQGIKFDRVLSILTNPLYAGYLELPSWDVSFRKAQHEALVSLETFQRVRDALASKGRTFARTDINDDFPLRGWVQCGCCGHPLTANWSKGSNQSYPYYLCRQPDCDLRGKSIARDRVESDFGQLLRTITPSAELVELASTVLRDLWDARSETAKQEKITLRRQVAAIDDKVAQLLDRVVESENRSVVAAYESRISDLEREKLVLAERIAACGKPLADYDETFRTAIEYLSSPWILWESDRLEDKRAVLKLTFAGQLAYDKNDGFRTPDLALPFKTLAEFSAQDEEMARPAGLEPATVRLEGGCSIRLSYGRLNASRTVCGWSQSCRHRP